LPKRKIKEEKPKKRLGKKELLIAPIAMGAATLVALVIIPAFAPPPNPTTVCLKAHNVETFQLFPTVDVFVDGQHKMLPDGVGKQPKADGQDCLRPIHTDAVGNVVHIEYIRPIRFNMNDFMKIYSYDGSTITVADNSTGAVQTQTLQLDNYTLQYSYFSSENADCDGTREDRDCYTYQNDLTKFPPFTKDMLARVELTSK
jgi:hypothetical protein